MEVSEVQKLYTNKASLYHYFFVDLLGWERELRRFFKESKYLHPNMKILDAGCGAGIATKVLHELSLEKKYEGIQFNGFDITPAMLGRFKEWIKSTNAKNITLAQADALDLASLPEDWREYDLIVSSAMLEYLPKDKIRHALKNLRQRLKKNGKILVFITGSNFFTKLLVGWWWKANTYGEEEIRQVFEDSGFGDVKIKDVMFKAMFAIEAENAIS